MPATLDLTAVRRFTDDLNDRLRRCDNGEGMECSTLESGIEHYVKLCEELRECIHQWARAVFSGEIAHDPEVEKLLQEETKLLLHKAQQVVERAEMAEGPCFFFEWLPHLYRHIAGFDDMLREWVSPRLAVSPAPRVKLPEAVEQKIEEQLRKLPPLPKDWRQTDPA